MSAGRPDEEVSSLEDRRYAHSMLAGRTPEAQLRNLLSCAVDRAPTLKKIRSWSDRQRKAAERWASSAYLRSVGFDLLHPPAPLPRFLRG